MSYARVNVFSDTELDQYEQARTLVDRLPRELLAERRCHEVARAVAKSVAGVRVQDGHYDYVEHTWLWTQPLLEEEVEIWAPGWFHAHRPKILDVYLPGCVPSVCLLDPFGHLALPRAYRWGPGDMPPITVREDVVDELHYRMTREKL